METINEYAKGEPPNRIIKFGPLFSIYENYSDKVALSKSLFWQRNLRKLQKTVPCVLSPMEGGLC